MPSPRRATAPALAPLLLALALAGIASTSAQEKDAPPAATPQVDHLAMGSPGGASADAGTPTDYLLKKRQYVMSYNSSKGTPNWVSWHLSKRWLGKARRGNAFAPEAGLPEGFLLVRPNDYRGAGFDRGHLCPAGDRSVDKADQDATFSMANMVPQAPDLNRKTWEKLEEYLRDQARDGQEIWVVAGPSGKGGWGEHGYKTYLRGHGGKITVPGKCWKVALILDAGVTDPARVTTSNARMVAVIMPNQQGLDTAWRTYAVSVAEVEELTGYTFFSRLPADVAKELKAKTETRARPTRTAGKGGEKEPHRGGGKEVTGKGKGEVAGELPGFKEGCIVGNRRSKKYHLPGERYYEKAKESKNAVFFESAKAAEEAGYTKAGGRRKK